MLAGAREKLKQWRHQRKTTIKIMNTSKQPFQKRLTEIKDQLSNLKTETDNVIDQLNQQISTLNDIDEDTTAVIEKITLLKESAKAIEKGQQDSEAFESLFNYVESVNDAVNKGNEEIEELRHQSNSLSTENKKLRTELQIFQDYHERSEMRVVELEVQVEHLKFINGLPPDNGPFFGSEDGEVNSEELSLTPKVIIPFLEDDFPEKAGCYILSVLDEMNFKENSRLQILFDLIKSYIKKEAFDIAIPLLKTTIEDLSAKYNSHESIVFKMMEVLAIVCKITQRWTDGVEFQHEILRIRQEYMPDDELSIAKTLSNIAVLYAKTGKETKARVFSRQALNLKNKIFGDCDLETAKELHNLGILYFMDNQSTKAIDCLLKALSMMQTAQKQNAFCIARTEANLGIIYAQDDQLSKAKSFFDSSLKYLNKELEKLLEGEDIQIERIVADKKILSKLQDCKKDEIEKLLQLLTEVEESRFMLQEGDERD